MGLVEAVFLVGLVGQGDISVLLDGEAVDFGSKGKPIIAHRRHLACPFMRSAEAPSAHFNRCRISSMCRCGVEMPRVAFFWKTWSTIPRRAASLYRPRDTYPRHHGPRSPGRPHHQTAAAVWLTGAFRSLARIVTRTQPPAVLHPAAPADRPDSSQPTSRPARHHLSRVCQC